jgi:hypothetical protein
MAFPGSRSTFELWDGAIGYGLIAITAVIVVFLWGPTTLARFRYARSASSRWYTRIYYARRTWRNLI